MHKCFFPCICRTFQAGRHAPWLFRRYYGYRLSGAFDADPRLAVLDPDWLAGKRCLDVGCHQGIVALALALRFRPSAYTGIDIDGELVKRAIKGLQGHRRVLV